MAAGWDPNVENAATARRFGIGRLFALTHEAVVGADLDVEKIVLWNPSAERMFGYSAEEAIGLPLDTIVAPELKAAHHAGIDRFRSTHRPVLVGGNPVEVPAVTRDGRRLVIALSLTEIPDGEPGRFVVAVIRDVTEQKHAEAELIRTNEAMRDFVAVASHDLRTPITGIVGFAQMLRDRPDDFTADQRDQFLDAVLRSGERASRLIDDLLTVSKIQADLVETRPESFLVESVLADVAALFDPRPDLSVEAALSVVVDRDHFSRMIENFVSNANKYGRPPVVISARRSGSSIEVRVCDHGDGIPKEFRDRAFDKFVRMPSVTTGNGNGLGLSIVRGLAIANGGEAFYEHTGDATKDAVCFGVRLPRSPS